MHSRTVEQVHAWDSRPFAGGLQDLLELSDSDHTGAVVAGDTWLFMLNGRVVGVFEGSIEDFGESGTVYAAPHDSVPLLFAMQEREGRTRAKYFTEDTPLEEADQTLADANFTGYVELSENVLSGDYYLVYYGGTRRSVAFVGESERLVTGEDAFELAADEVGLYEVMDVSMTITEIPEPEPAAEPEGPAVESDPDTGPETTATAETETAGATADPSPDPAESDVVEPEPDVDRPDAQTAAATADSSAGPQASEPESGPETAATESGPETAATEHEPTESPPTAATEPDTGDEAEPGTTAPDTEPDPQDGDTAPTDDELDRMFRAEAEWRRTRAVPALDPDRTESHEADSSSTDQSTTPGTQGAATATVSQAAGSQSSGDRSRDQRSESASDRLSQLRDAVAERDQHIEVLEEQLAEAESRNETLESELDSLREEHSTLTEELETLRAERDELQARVAELEAGDTDHAGSDLDPETALAGTNLFVRYRSKGEPTLESIEEADPEAINQNLQLEHHTQFETEGLQVAGQPFRAFLESSGPFRFVSWLLRELPAELLETETDSKLGELFAAIPSIDRVEFGGTVTVDPESGAQREFAIVMRDRMGNPLVLTATNEGRDPVPGEELDRLLDGAREVADVADSLAGAIYVTASFFEPAALESAQAAASSGGLFSRQEKASYVKSDAGNGFHLSLVEDRSETFHVTVPEL